MTLFLLIIIALMVLVTMVCSIIGTILIVKENKAFELVRKVLSITGIVLVIALVIGAAYGVSNMKKDNKNGKADNKTSETVALEEAGFNEVTLDEYLNLIKEPEKNIILVARPTCGYCEAFAPILSEAADDLKLAINYIDTDKFSQDDWSVFSESLDYLNSEEWGTPLTLIVQNGEVVAENNGYAELDAIRDFFKKNGLGE